jgi:hypothetical protein
MEKEYSRVLTVPGNNALHLTPHFPSATAQLCIKLVTPAFVGVSIPQISSPPLNQDPHNRVNSKERHALVLTHNDTAPHPQPTR